MDVPVTSPHTVSDDNPSGSEPRRHPPVRRASSCQALRHAVLTLYRLDDFTMCQIGSGFFSEVFKVTHKVSNQIMVLKMNTSEDNRPNMLREVQLMNRMSHPNILKFLGVCVHEGQLHALTEYISGGSLHGILCEDKDAPVFWNDRVQIATDVSSGMKYLHSKGIFHRDLTSRNILIGEQVREGSTKCAVVADFGLATKIPDPCREFHLSIVGSPYWMAPECINGQPYNETADIFSFGIILCETIARIDADPDVLPRTQNFGLDYIAYSELLEDCPLRFLFLAFQCCQMDPRRRPSFAELLKNLEEISKIQPVHLEKTTPVGQQLSPGSLALKQFNHRLSFYNQRSCSEQSLDFLKTDDSKYLSATAKVIGNYMTKDDPFYEPAPANTNPFASNAQLSTGKKLVASDTEREQVFELSATLPLSTPVRMVEDNNNNVCMKPKVSLKQSHSLPDSHGVVQRAIAQFNAQISSSNTSKIDNATPMEKLMSSGYASTESSVDDNFTSYDFVRQNSKQRNLECAMLFCGLDLIQMHRVSSSEWSDTQISTDLESEFQDDLEDVLRQSRLGSEDPTLSPTADSAFSDVDTELWFSEEQADPTSSRYFHPTLVEQRKQLRKVENRKQKEKLELLQIKLEQLRVTAHKASKHSRRFSNRL